MIAKWIGLSNRPMNAVVKKFADLDQNTHDSGAPEMRKRAKECVRSLPFSEKKIFGMSSQEHDFHGDLFLALQPFLRQNSPQRKE